MNVEQGILSIRQIAGDESTSLLVEKALGYHSAEEHKISAKVVAAKIFFATTTAGLTAMALSRDASAQAPICPPPPFASEVDGRNVYFVPIEDSAVAVDARTSQNIPEDKFSSAIRENVDKLRNEIQNCKNPKPVISSPQKNRPEWPNMPLENHVGAALFVGVIAAFWGLISGHIAFPRKVPCQYDESGHITGEWNDFEDEEHAIAMYIIKNPVLGGSIKGMAAYVIATAGTIFAGNSSLIQSITSTFFHK